MNIYEVAAHVKATFELTNAEAMSRTIGMYEDLDIKPAEQVSTSLLGEIEHCIGYDIKKGR